MEKRLLLSFLLSFLVLFVWGALNPRPQQPSRPLGSPLEEPEQVAEAPGFLPEKSLPPGEPRPVASSVSESTQILENSKIRAAFSNIGGTLQGVEVAKYGVSLPVTHIFDVVGYEADGFRLDNIRDSHIRYVLRAPGINIYKSYHIVPDSHLIEAKIELERTDRMSSLGDIKIQGFRLDISRLDSKDINPRDKSLYEYSIAAEKIHRKSNAFKFSAKEARTLNEIVKWTGFRDRYFGAVVKPHFESTGYDVEYIDEQNLAIRLHVKNSDIPVGSRIGYDATVYVGPQDPAVVKKYDLDVKGFLAFSGWGLLNTIAKGIYALMTLLHRVLPNWGVCIILISLLIYGAMYPLTMKGMLSMKRMQALQPKVTDLRDKYQSNPQKLNKEIMELYKKHRINPLGGCLPLLLQMPVFIGLYQVLWRSVSFKGANFLWIQDLSQPDRLMIFPFTLPIIGNELNILPLVMIVVMAIQQRISAKNMTVTDPAQITQQKMMMTVMPVFIGFIFYKFASGLSLYFTVFYLLSTLTQWKMSKVNVVL